MPQMHIFMGFGPWMLAAGVLHPCGPSLFNLVYTPCMFSVKPFTCRPGITIVVDGIKKQQRTIIYHFYVTLTACMAVTFST